jgi:hypothetical protein
VKPLMHLRKMVKQAESLDKNLARSSSRINPQRPHQA